jgi:hypothetical protein
MQPAKLAVVLIIVVFSTHHELHVPAESVPASQIQRDALVPEPLPDVTLVSDTIKSGAAYAGWDSQYYPTYGHAVATTGSYEVTNVGFEEADLVQRGWLKTPALIKRVKKAFKSIPFKRAKALVHQLQWNAKCQKKLPGRRIGFCTNPNIWVTDVTKVSELQTPCKYQGECDSVLCIAKEPNKLASTQMTVFATGNETHSKGQILVDPSRQVPRGGILPRFRRGSSSLSPDLR